MLGAAVLRQPWTTAHLELGRALSSLRMLVLMLGSGASYHNMRGAGWRAAGYRGLQRLAQPSAVRLPTGDQVCAPYCLCIQIHHVGVARSHF
jgi:hypothetical protein